MSEKFWIIFWGICGFVVVAIGVTIAITHMYLTNERKPYIISNTDGTQQVCEWQTHGIPARSEWKCE